MNETIIAVTILYGFLMTIMWIRARKVNPTLLKENGLLRKENGETNRQLLEAWANLVEVEFTAEDLKIQLEGMKNENLRINSENNDLAKQAIKSIKESVAIQQELDDLKNLNGREIITLKASRSRANLNGRIFDDKGMKKAISKGIKNVLSKHKTRNMVEAPTPYMKDCSAAGCSLKFMMHQDEHWKNKNTGSKTFCSKECMEFAVDAVITFEFSS